MLCCLVIKTCPTLHYPKDYSPPGFYPWDFPGKITGVGCHFLLQGIFPNQGPNTGLLHWQEDSLPESHQGSPYEALRLSNLWRFVVFPGQQSVSGVSTWTNLLVTFSTFFPLWRVVCLSFLYKMGSVFINYIFTENNQSHSLQMYLYRVLQSSLFMIDLIFIIVISLWSFLILWVCVLSLFSWLG